MKFFDHHLGEREYNQLLDKGYLKVKFLLPLTSLKNFDLQYRLGTEVIFKHSSIDIKTNVSSIEVSEEMDDKCRIYIGFTLQ